MLEPTYASEAELLGDLLGVLRSGGSGDIYGPILNLTYKKADEWEFEAFRHIIGCVVVLREPFSISAIRDILDLRKTKENNPVDPVNFFRRLRTVLISGADAIDENTIPLLHKSFFEYITSDRAENRFRVYPELSNVEILTQCLRHLTTFYNSDPKSLTRHSSPDSVPTPLQHTIRFLGTNLSREESIPSGMAVVPGALSLDEVREQLQTSLKKGSLGKTLCITSLSIKSQILTSWDNTIQAWDRLSGQPVSLPPFEGHTDYVKSVAFSPDGTCIISGSNDNTIRLWDVHSGKAIGSPFQGHANSVWSVAFSRDGMHIISGSFDHTVRLWDVKSGKLIGSPFTGHDRAVTCVAVSPDGMHVISGGGGGTIRLWEVQTGKAIHSPFQGHTDWVESVAFSPDGARVISGGDDKTIRLWDTRSGKAIHSPFQGHTGGVESVALSPTGTYVVSGSRDRTIRLWDVQNGKVIRSLTDHSGEVKSVAFSPDGKRIVSGSSDRTIRLWDVESGKAIGSPFTGHTSVVYSVVFSPDGTHIVSGSYDKTVQLWNAHTGKPAQLRFQIQNGYMSSLAVFSASQRVACASSDGTVQIWELEGSQPTGTPLTGDLACITSVAVSPDEKSIAAVDSKGKVCLWNVDSRRLLSHAETTFSGPTSLSFSPNSTQLILPRLDGSVFRLDITDGNLKPAGTSPLPVSTLLPQNDKAMAFDMRSGWKRGNDQSEAALYWFPFEDPDAGLWAYADGKLIRHDGEDSVTIFDVGGDSGNEGRAE
jgi:WD40 repeat protein